MGMTILEKASLCYNSAGAKKALDVVMLDVRGKCEFADVFLIASGSSNRQVQAIVSSIEGALRASGEKNYHMEGYDNAWWALIDAGDIVVHVFIEEARRYYDLERHWADATRLEPDGAALTSPAVSG